MNKEFLILDKKAGPAESGLVVHALFIDVHSNFEQTDIII